MKQALILILVIAVIMAMQAAPGSIAGAGRNFGEIIGSIFEFITAALGSSGGGTDNYSGSADTFGQQP